MNNSKSLFKGINRNVLILGMVSFFTDLSSQIVVPVIPLYLTSVLGVGALAVGIVEGAAESTASLLKVVSGFWSDKIKKRKPFVFWGYSLSAISKPLFALAGSWGLLLFFRILERMGKGLRTAPRDAIVAASSESGKRGKAFGIHRAMDGIGSVLGALLAFFLLPVLGYEKLLLFAFIPAFIAVIFIRGIREKKLGSAQRVVEKKDTVLFGAMPRPLKIFIGVASLFAFGHFGYAFLLLRANHIGLGDDRAIFLYVLFYLVYTVVSIPAGWLSDKVGRKPVLFSAYLLFAFISLGLIFTNAPISLLVFFILYGIFYAVIDGVQRAFVADLSPAGLKATSLGFFHTAIGLFALPGGIIAGWLWDSFMPEATFVFGFVLSLMAAVLFLFMKNK